MWNGLPVAFSLSVSKLVNRNSTIQQNQVTQHNKVWYKHFAALCTAHNEHTYFIGEATGKFEIQLPCRIHSRKEGAKPRYIHMKLHTSCVNTIFFFLHKMVSMCSVDLKIGHTHTERVEDWTCVGTLQVPSMYYVRYCAASKQVWR